MDKLHARPLALLTLLALVMAGCATSDPAGTDPTAPTTGETPPTAVSTAEAQDVLRRAASVTPDSFGVRIAFTRGSQTLLQLNGTFDNASQTDYMEMRGDPAALRALSEGEGSEMAGGFADMMAQGFAIYTTPEGGLYMTNGTAFVFPPKNETDGEGAFFVPHPEENPFADFFDPKEGLVGLNDPNTTVTAVRPATFRGQPALEIDVTSRDNDNRTINATVTVLDGGNPRVVRIEGTTPSDPADPADPLAGARYVAEVFYEGDAEMEAPEAARRALALSYESDLNPFQPREGPATWTFLVSGGVPLDEVEVQVKESEDEDASGGAGEPSSPADLPNLWTMRLSEGSKTQDGLTLAFTDADGDGKVSKGDTLRIDAGNESDEPPTVVLYDTKTGTHVIPGPALLAALAGVGLAAWLLRRRG